MPSDEIPSRPAEARPLPNRAVIALLAFIFLAGIALRIFAPPAFKTRGHDEILYMSYVEMLDGYSVLIYPKIVELIIPTRTGTTEAQLPPTRFLYIFCGYCWDKLFPSANGDNSTNSQMDALRSLHAVSCLFSILTMPLAALFAFRLGGIRTAVGILALVAFSPMQIYVAHHALIDGFFAFWALLTLWLLWENLQKPGSYRWLAAYTACLALMVLTKENAFFVFVAILGIFILNRWAKFGTVNRLLVLCTFARRAAPRRGRHCALLAAGL